MVDLKHVTSILQMLHESKPLRRLAWGLLTVLVYWRLPELLRAVAEIVR